MSSLLNDQTKWTVQEDDYTLMFNLLYSKNTDYSEQELWEYGISCRLFCENQDLISEAAISHITPSQEIIRNYLHILIENRVFPVHLKDVILDLLAIDFS